ncbi:MAG: DNA alkylation repair protein [Saprospiraceae bacterium]|nr:DNA alkylation repair protein [Saprospiraceae bacterium]
MLKSSPERKKTNEWFFKTGKGEYGEGDIFIGLSNPDVRGTTSKYLGMDFQEIKKLLGSPIHEIRFAGLIILTENAKKAFRKKDNKSLKIIADFYLENRKAVNNWDLVDLSSYSILGNTIQAGVYDMQILERLSSSDSLWDRRIAMVSTYTFIKHGDIYPTLALAGKLLDNREDLMHKAVGWMLREAWKVDPKLVESFIIDNYSRIPRTALRYAIEKMDEEKRQEFLKWEG